MKKTKRLLSLLMSLLLLTACTPSGSENNQTSQGGSAGDGNSVSSEVTTDSIWSDVRTRPTALPQTGTTVPQISDKPSGKLTVTDGTAVFIPYEDDAVLLNPDMGWVLLDVAEKRHQDLGQSGDYPLIQNVGILTGWSELEPVEGQYNWDVLDETINYWAGKGKRLHFRISTDCFPYFASSYSCPEWVYRAGVPHQAKVDWSGQAVKYPDYTNPTYREKLTNFMKAYSDKYRSLEALDCVDLRGYGEFGEWHAGYQYNDWDTRVNALKWILDTWVNAWDGDKMLFLSYCHETDLGYLLDGTHATTYEEYLEFSAFDYAINKFSPNALGFRRDGVAATITSEETKFSGELYKNNRVQIAEFCNGYVQYKTEGKSIRTCINEALSLHPNYIVMMGWDKNGGANFFYEYEIDEIKYALKNMGYRMALVEASYPSAISAGEKLEVTTVWANDAYGVLPYGYTMQVAAYDATGKRVAINTSTSFSPASFSQHRGSEVASATTLSTNTLSKGEYTLRCAILDNDKKPILLPIQGQQADGFYSIGKFTVQ